MRQKVKIIELNHPHYGELAELIASEEGTIQIYEMFGKEKLKVHLIDCPHLVESCYVGRNGIEIAEPVA